MNNYFIFDGVNSKDLGLTLIDGTDSYGSAQRSVSRKNVPGKNGSITLDDGYFDDVDFTIAGGIRSNMPDALRNLNDFLSVHSTGWYRLELTHHPDEFVLAQYKSMKTTVVRNRFAHVEMDFIRKPQRFLKSGERMTSIRSGNMASLRNPTFQEAKPLIRIYCTGNGTVSIGSQTITIAEGTRSYIDLDCDLHIAYEGTANRGSLITLTGWPVMKANGYTNITMSGDVTKVEITPRWFTL